MFKSGICAPRLYAFLFALLLGPLAGCATQPPSQPDNICQLFSEKKSWRKVAWQAEKKWGTPVPVSLAFVYQESSFKHNVRPKKKTRFLGIFPIEKRDGSSMGYTQAKKETWRQFQKKTKKPRASRKNFKDSMHFVGWYNRISKKKLKISLDDPYHLYLAYHEGHGGYRSGRWRSNPALVRVAKKVESQANLYDRQLQACTPRKMKKRKRL